MQDTSQKIARLKTMPVATTIVEPSSAPRVLVVEDNSTNLLVARRMLEISGFQVEVATNGRDAVAAAGNRPYDLILMDIHMPVLDGCEASMQIRQLPGPAGRVPIIALSASVFSEDIRRCFDAGADDFIAKPFLPGELIAKCQLWLKHGRRGNPAVLKANGSASPQKSFTQQVG
jgi:two-component system, sensor histidine kinase and response regulator